jgi:hypothetical protein
MSEYKNEWRKPNGETNKFEDAAILEITGQTLGNLAISRSAATASRTVGIGWRIRSMRIVRWTP